MREGSGLQVKSQSAMKILLSSAVRQTAAPIAKLEKPRSMEAPHFARLVVRRPQISTTGARVRAPSVKAFQPDMCKQIFRSRIVL
jgi:hypothetical protein